MIRTCRSYSPNAGGKGAICFESSLIFKGPLGINRVTKMWDRTSSRNLLGGHGA